MDHGGRRIKGKKREMAARALGRDRKKRGSTARFVCPEIHG